MSFSHWRRDNSWNFGHVNGTERERLGFQPYLSMNDFAGLAPALLAGGGVGDLPATVQPELVSSGRLVKARPDRRIPTFDLSEVHLGPVVSRVRSGAFKEFAVQMTPGLFRDLTA